MIKKFTDFTNEEITVKTGNRPTTVSREDVRKSAKKVVKKSNKEPEAEEPKVANPKVKEPKMENNQFNLNGKIATMPSTIKPSTSIVLLENNNISKDKLHYIISKQTQNTLVLLKYNEKAEIKVTEFVKTLVSYYMRNEQLINDFKQIVIEGTEHFTILKNIPNITLENKKLIDILNENIINLLK